MDTHMDIQTAPPLSVDAGADPLGLDSSKKKKEKPPSRCRFCSMTFKKLEHAQRHERTHTLDRPYPCKFCGKAFARQDTLNRHARLHTRNPDGTMSMGKRRKSSTSSAGSGRKKDTPSMIIPHLQDVAGDLDAASVCPLAFSLPVIPSFMAYSRPADDNSSEQVLKSLLAGPQQQLPTPSSNTDLFANFNFSHQNGLEDLLVTSPSSGSLHVTHAPNDKTLIDIASQYPSPAFTEYSPLTVGSSDTKPAVRQHVSSNALDLQLDGLHLNNASHSSHSTSDPIDLQLDAMLFSPGHSEHPDTTLMNDWNGQPQPHPGNMSRHHSINLGCLASDASSNYLSSGSMGISPAALSMSLHNLNNLGASNASSEEQKNHLKSLDLEGDNANLPSLVSHAVNPFSSSRSGSRRNSFSGMSHWEEVQLQQQQQHLVKQHEGLNEIASYLFGKGFEEKMKVAGPPAQAPEDVTHTPVPPAVHMATPPVQEPANNTSHRAPEPHEHMTASPAELGDLPELNSLPITPESLIYAAYIRRRNLQTQKLLQVQQLQQQQKQLLEKLLDQRKMVHTAKGAVGKQPSPRDPAAADPAAPTSTNQGQSLYVPI